MISFTICSNNYLAEAITLGQSLKAKGTLPDHFKIFLIDHENPEIKYDEIPFEIILVTEKIVPCFKAISTLYDIVELSTAIKPSIFKYLITQFPKSSFFIYLDPDLNFFQNIEITVAKEIENYSILLTPHLLKPALPDQEPFENVFLNFGIYNLGFIAIKVDEISLKLLDWWELRTMKLGFNDVSNGLFVDQLWINLAPIFFENIKITKNPGFNVAYWNLSERLIEFKNEIQTVNIDFPLIFFHFSSFDFSLKQLSRRSYSFNEKKSIPVKTLMQNYKNALENNDYTFYKKFKPFYSVSFDNYLYKSLNYIPSKEKIFLLRLIKKLIPTFIFNRIRNFIHLISILDNYT